PAAGRPVQPIDTPWLCDRPVYRLGHMGDVWLASAETTRPVMVDAADVASIAAADYVGDGRPSAPRLMREATLEARGHARAIWRVGFSGGDATTLYVSAQDGRILERRNDAWRLFDIVWMLHI